MEKELECKMIAVADKVNPRKRYPMKKKNTPVFKKLQEPSATFKLPGTLDFPIKVVSSLSSFNTLIYLHGGKDVIREVTDVTGAVPMNLSAMKVVSDEIKSTLIEERIYSRYCQIRKMLLPGWTVVRRSGVFLFTSYSSNNGRIPFHKQLLLTTESLETQWNLAATRIPSTKDKDGILFRVDTLMKSIKYNIVSHVDIPSRTVFVLCLLMEVVPRTDV